MASNAAITAIFTAGAGLDGNNAGGRLVKVDASGIVTLATAPTDNNVVGILNKPATSGNSAYVTVQGTIGEVRAGGVISPGDYLTTDTEGRVVTASTGNLIMGQYLPSKGTNGGFGSTVAGQLISDVNVPALKLIAAP